MGIHIDLNQVLGVIEDVLGEVKSFITSHTVAATSTSFSLSYQSDVLTFSGTGLTYLLGLPIGGTISEVTATHGTDTLFDVSGFSLTMPNLVDILAHSATPAAIAAAMPAASVIKGGAAGDVLSLAGAAASHELRGLDGDDSLTGSSGDDLINGNRGRDTVDGGVGGNDTLMGGQGDDLIRGQHGLGLLNGNIGNDTVQAGDSGDTLHGGQGDDVLVGGAGADNLYGDLGNDTLSGGAGADVFHIASGGGRDVVTDFHTGEGDRIAVDHADPWTVAQVGGDTVVTLSDGAQITLAGVQASALPSDWIFAD
jgi:Ca2+-binding RTX toxin-like protein